jgi:hypothetical protein
MKTLPRAIAPHWRVLAAACLILIAGSAGALAVSKYRPKPEERWVTYENPRFGYRLYYPSALFSPGQPPENGSGLTFTARDGRAKIVVFGAQNSENYSPQDYRRILLKDFGGYDRLGYSPVGKTWFVLTGFRGENIYYQKVMFTCANKVISVFSMTFPKAEKPFYEGLIEIMEDNFHPGRGTDTPKGC